MPSGLLSCRSTDAAQFFYLRPCVVLQAQANSGRELLVGVSISITDALQLKPRWRSPVTATGSRTLLSGRGRDVDCGGLRWRDRLRRGGLCERETLRRGECERVAVRRWRSTWCSRRWCDRDRLRVRRGLGETLCRRSSRCSRDRLRRVRLDDRERWRSPVRDRDWCILDLFVAATKCNLQSTELPRKASEQVKTERFFFEIST